MRNMPVCNLRLDIAASARLELVRYWRRGTKRLWRMSLTVYYTQNQSSVEFIFLDNNVGHWQSWAMRIDRYHLWVSRKWSGKGRYNLHFSTMPVDFSPIIDRKTGRRVVLLVATNAPRGAISVFLTDADIQYFGLSYTWNQLLAAWLGLRTSHFDFPQSAYS